MQRIRILWLASISSIVFGQTGLTVTPSQLSFGAVSSGAVLALSKSVVVTATGNWKATVGSGPADMLAVSPAQGSGSGNLSVNLTPWWVTTLSAGTYSQTVVVSDSSTSKTITVTLTVVEKRPGPNFTALAGPNGCATVQGLPDQAVCNVPGEKPPGTFTPPPVGGSYVDPNFGANIKVLAGPKALHGYSSPTAISATGKYVIVYGNNTTAFQVIDRKTAKVAIDNLKTGFEGVIWDSRNDDLLYFFLGATVQQYSLSKATATAIADYSKPPYRFTSISAGGTGDASRQNWIPFSAPKENQLCALALDTQKTYCASYAAIPGGPFQVDFPQMAKGIDKSTGKRYVLLFAIPVMLFFSVNEKTGVLDFEFKGPELLGGNGNHDGICDPGETCLGSPHGDTFEDSQGTQFLMAPLEFSVPCGFFLVSYQINKGAQLGNPVELGGGLRVIMQLYRCGAGDNWADLHVGCARNAPLCAISTTYGGLGFQRTDNDTTPIVRSPHLSEIFVVRDNGVEVKRLVEHRSVPFKSEGANSYWTTPRACMSMDGSFIVADSNFGVPNAHRVVVIETGLGPMRIADSGIVNPASFDSKIAPEDLVTIFGENLSNCLAQADPAAVNSTLCGVSVTMQGQAAFPYFVSPSQINVIAPANLAPGADTIVSVVKADDPAESATAAIGSASVLEAAPAMFSIVQADSSRTAAVQVGNQWAGPSSPLHLGDTGTLYACGLGATIPSATISGARDVVNPVTVYINDVPQTVLFSVSLPALYGLNLIGIQTNTATPVLSSGNQIWLNSQSVESQRLDVQIAAASP